MLLDRIDDVVNNVIATRNTNATIRMAPDWRFFDAENVCMFLILESHHVHAADVLDRDRRRKYTAVKRIGRRIVR